MRPRLALSRSARRLIAPTSVLETCAGSRRRYCQNLRSPHRRRCSQLLAPSGQPGAANTASRVVLSSFPSLQARPSKGQAGQTFLLGEFSPRRKLRPMQPDELLLFRGAASLCLPSHILDPRALLPRPHFATNGPGAAPAARDWPSENPGRRSWALRRLPSQGSATDKVPEDPRTRSAASPMWKVRARPG